MHNKILFADQLRALAVFFVLIAHYMGVFWYDNEMLIYTNIAPYNWEKNIPSIVSILNTLSLPPFLNWGPLGVDIFFLISGFVIPISLEKYTWKQFLIQRFLRLYPTYFFSFIFLILMVVVASYYFDHPFIYKFKTIIMQSILGLREFTGIVSIDHIVWTLEVELKFYLLSAMFIVLFKYKTIGVFLIPIIFAFFVYFVMPTHFDMVHVIYLYIGTVYYYHYKQRIKTWTLVLLTGIILSLFIFLYFSLGMNIFSIVYLNQMFANGVYAIIIFSLAYFYREKFQYNRVLSFFSRISYPFYIIHGVSGYIIIMILFDLGIPILIGMVIAFCILIGVAYMLHIYVEKPSQKLSKKIIKTLRNKQ